MGPAYWKSEIDSEPYVAFRMAIGEETNNVAEYCGLRKCMERAHMSAMCAKAAHMSANTPNMCATWAPLSATAAPLSGKAPTLCARVVRQSRAHERLGGDYMC